MKRSLILTAAAFATFTTGAAFAHSGDLPHAHPHGMETAIALAVLAVAIVGAVWFLRRR